MPALHQDKPANSHKARVSSDGEGSDVQGLFEEAAPFIEQLTIAAEIETATDVEDSSVALERLSELSDAMANHSSGSVREVALKVALYRAIAPEAALQQDLLTTDERLLGSIMRDIEKIS
jgi:hypothetical protein